MFQRNFSWMKVAATVLHGMLLPIAGAAVAQATEPIKPKHFSANSQTAVKFGVHEIVLQGDGDSANPFDTKVTITFTPPSGHADAKTVWGFYDGDHAWKARVYVSEQGNWTWHSECDSNAGLDGEKGAFSAIQSTEAALQLPGRLLIHPRNSRQWITENGRWFLNLNDTAYFLLCAYDGNGEPVSDDNAMKYVRDDVERGITSVRCFLASRRGGFAESREQWIAWHFENESLERLRLDTLQQADSRLRKLLDEFPDVAVQLIMFPLEGYGRDGRFWIGMSADERERLLRNLVARFAAYPQLLWLVTNDAHYGDKFPNSNAMVREVGDYLMEHDPWQHPRSTGHARKLPFYFGGEDWVDYVHIEHAHDLGAQQYGPYHKFAKPVFLGEDRYENDHGPRQDPHHMRYWQRRLFWTWLLSGGSANYGGRWWTVHPYTETGVRSATFHQRPAVTFRDALTGLDSVRPIRDYFEKRSIDLGDFEPDHKLVQDANGRAEMQQPKLMRRGHEEFLIYHPNAASDGQEANVDASQTVRLRVDLRGATGRLGVEWYRVENGEATGGEETTAGDWRELTAPWPGDDVVVRLRQRRK